MLRKIFLLFLGVLILSQSVFAAGLYVYFTQDAIKDKDGGNITPVTDYHDGGADGGPKLQLYKGSLPAPNQVGSPIGAAAGVAYSSITIVEGGKTYKYQYDCLGSGFNGTKVYIRVWKGTVCPTTANPSSYYGKTDDNASSGTATPNDKWISELKTEYQCQKPYAPSIGNIDEALNRVGNSLEAELVVHINPGSGSEGLREVTSYDLIVTFPDSSVQTFTNVGSSKTLSDAQTGHYVFKAVANNWWGSTEGPEKPYDTLGGGTITTDEITITLNKIEGGMGINNFGIPFSTVYDAGGTQIFTIRDLVTAINATGEGYVATCGFWDAAQQKEVGFTFDQDATVLNKVNTEENPENINLSRAMGYQVSVTGNKSLKLKNYN
ncbi:MAG: hypothetical protein JW782_05500 [Candidatus Saganbacteria bacterium]|nr:hypothetical protein [Candidatus Saganbacteria bacterium]